MARISDGGLYLSDTKIGSVYGGPRFRVSHSPFAILPSDGVPIDASSLRYGIPIKCPTLGAKTCVKRFRLSLGILS